MNWNSGRQVRLTGFEQDHWEGEMRNWYQVERKVGDERIWEDGEKLEKTKRKAPE